MKELEIMEEEIRALVEAGSIDEKRNKYTHTHTHTHIYIYHNAHSRKETSITKKGILHPRLKWILIQKI